MQINSNTTDYRQFITDNKNALYEKIKNGDTEVSYQIGAKAYTEKEWDKILAEFDDAQETVRKMVEEEQEKKEEERLENEYLERYQMMSNRYLDTRLFE